MAAHCLKTLLRTCMKRQTTVSFGLSCIRIPKRNFLSTTYGNTKHWKKFNDIDGDLLRDMSSTCLFIDRCSERNYPFTSLTMDKMVRTIEDREDIDTSMYYLYKFRHSDACYFLRPWTMHIWFSKCIEHDAKDLALKALDETAHYGLFPDDVAFNMFLWDCLKNESHEMAFKVASHMFLLERLDSKLSQSLCLMTILKRLKITKDSAEAVTLPEFQSLAEKRNFGGICLRLGQLMDIRNIEMLGFGIVGAIEKENSIRSVYQNPWAPLSWEKGYFERGLRLMGSEGTPVPRDVINILLEVVKDTEELINLLNDKISTLESEKLISEDNFLDKLNENLASLIPEAEKDEQVAYENTIAKWVDEYKELCDIEKQIDVENTIEREKYFKSKKISETAKRMAIEQLGYWELLKSDDDNKDIPPHLRDDFVKGSTSDVQIERRRDTDEIYFYPIQSVAEQ
ncbi:small ribosomal subunit protein mS27-like [Styela clava]